MRKIRLIAIVLVALGLSLPMNIANAESDIYSPSSEVFGFKFREWTAQWWQFVTSFPAAFNPDFFETTGSRCAYGQRGPVWFLMGTIEGGAVTRSCSIPEGKALFFPIINLVDINAPALTGVDQTASELRAEIDPCLDAVDELSVIVDGKNIRKLKDKSRIKSMVFDITVPNDGLLPAGVYSPVVDDGYYVMLKPLSVGHHTLHFIGSSGPNAACVFSPDGFSIDVTYSLDIVPVSLK